MKNTMAATALSFLMAVGGGVAVADTGSPATPATSSPSAAGQQGTRANAPAAVGFAEEDIQTGPWTVQRMDKQNRKLVLQAPDGTQNTVDIPSGTPGFDALKKGDQVRLEYFDAAVVEAPANHAKTPSSTRSRESTARGPSNDARGSTSAAANPSSNSGDRTVKAIHKVGHDTSGSVKQSH